MTHWSRQFFLVNWLKKERYVRSHLVGGTENAGNSPPQSDPSNLRKMRSYFAAHRSFPSRPHGKRICAAVPTPGAGNTARIFRSSAPVTLAMLGG